MAWNSSRFAAPIRYVAVGVLAAWMPLAATAEAMTASAVHAMYNKVKSAICRVEYTTEIANARTGQSQRRDMRVLGVVVSRDGLVLVHGHMQTEDREPVNVRVILGAGDEEEVFEADLLEKPEDVNVCFLRIRTEEPQSFEHVTFKQGASLSIGDPILIVGLMGERFDFEPAIAIRHVGAVLERPRTTYCIDEPLSFGFVSGAVLNALGDVVGVVGFDLTPAEGGDLYVRSGHPLVYQSDLLLPYVAQPGSVKSERANAWLGVFTQPLTDDFAEYWGLEKRGGVIASTIVPGSPADQAGMERGDVIVEFNGTPVRAKLVRELVGFTKLVRDAGTGHEVVVKALRAGQPMEFRLTLAEQPKSAREAGEYEDTVFGLTVREITTDLRYRLNLSEDVQGVIVRRVKSGSYADQAQFRPGVIIMNFGGHPVASVEDFQEALRKVVEEQPEELSIFCRIGPRTGFFRLQPRWGRGPQNESEG